MKKLFLIIISIFSFLVLQSQVNNQESKNYSEDIATLKKSMTIVQRQIKNQQLIISNQNNKIDSLNKIIAVLHNEIEEGSSNQATINESINVLSKRIVNINNALAERKTYVIIGSIIAIIILLLILYYLRKIFQKLNLLSSKKRMS